MPGSLTQGIGRTGCGLPVAGRPCGGGLHQAGHGPAIRMASELCLDLRATEGQSGKITALAVIWRSCDFIPSTNTSSAFNLTAHKVLFTRYLDLIRFLTQQAIA